MRVMPLSQKARDDLLLDAVDESALAPRRGWGLSAFCSRCCLRSRRVARLSGRPTGGDAPGNERARAAATRSVKAARRLTSGRARSPRGGSSQVRRRLGRQRRPERDRARRRKRERGEIQDWLGRGTTYVQHPRGSQQIERSHAETARNL
eukprot:4073205-Pleurochrysis_carterae.AAC.3